MLFGPLYSNDETLKECKQFMPMVVGPLSRVRPRNGILCLGLGLVVVVLVVPLRSEFIGEL